MQLAARTSDPFLLSSPSASAGAERYSVGLTGGAAQWSFLERYSVGLTGGAAQWSFLRRDSRLQNAAAQIPLDPYGAQVDVTEDHQATKQRDHTVHKSCVDSGSVGWTLPQPLRSKPWTNSVLAAAAVPTRALTSSKAVCAQGLLSRPLLPPRAEAQPCLCVGSRARTGCRLTLAV